MQSDNKNGGVYRILCIPNGKNYIGSTSNFRKRFLQHLCLLKKGQHGTTKLQEDWNTYGSDQFSFQPLHDIESPKIWIKVEKTVIRELNGSGVYNSLGSRGGKGKQRQLNMPNKITIYIPDHLLQYLYEQRKKNGFSISALIQEGLELLMEHRP